MSTRHRLAVMPQALRLLFPACVSVALGAFPHVCSADLAQAFQKEYPSAVAKLEDAYSHVKIDGTTSFRYPGDDKELYSRMYRFEVLRSADAIREVLTTVESTDPRWPVGAVTITGGNAGLEYVCYRKSAAKRYAFTRYDVRSSSGSSSSGGPAFAPYYVAYRCKLLDLLKYPNRHIVAVDSATLDGKDAVELSDDVSYQQNGQQRVMHEHFFLQPITWATLGWTVQRGPLTLQGRIAYQNDSAGGPPRIKTYETFEEDAAVGAERQNGTRYEVTQIDFGAIPKAQLTLAALGIKDTPVDDMLDARVSGLDGAAEPVGRGATGPTGSMVLGAQSPGAPLWVYGLVVLVSIVLGVFFCIKALRRQDRA